MKIVKDISEIKTKNGIAITFGKFDGLHVGHKLLIGGIISAKEKGYDAVAFSFNVPPSSVVRHEKSIVLMTNGEKEYALEKIGVDYLVEFPFTEEVMHMEAYDFVKQLTSKVKVGLIIVGDDFCFGYKRGGNVRLLEELKQEFGYELQIIKKLKSHGEIVSSTKIRESILSGDIDGANELLGYEYFIRGTVGEGRHLGSTIGIPTANIYPRDEKLVPKNGCYASRIKIDGDGEYFGITNIGTNPTVKDNRSISVETNIFDYEGDLYGKNITVSLMKFVREERKFDSVEALKNQINEDIAFVREMTTDKNILTVGAL